MNERDFRNAMEREAKSWPGVSCRWTRRSKHPAVVFSFEGREAMKVYPGSSGDRRAVRKAVADMRGLLRKLGAARARTSKAEHGPAAPDRHQRGPAPVKQLEPGQQPSRLSQDPWALLAAFRPHTEIATPRLPQNDPRRALRPGQYHEVVPMSDVSALEHGQITLLQFVEKVAGEFASNPFTKLMAPVLLLLVQAELTTTLKSPTAAALIVSDIQSVINGNPSALAGQAEAGAFAAIAGWASGQSGSQTGQQVLQAAEGAAETTQTTEQPQEVQEAA